MDTVPYFSLLEETQNAAAGAPPPGSEAEAAAIARFKDLWADMTPDRVRENAGKVYAGEAILYDTIVLHRGIDEIRPYLVKTAERAAGVRVSVLEVLRRENEFYLKWSMDIDWSSFKKGKTTRSFGISHLRFNADGEVILHFDFWDSTTGFFEHLPVLGAVIRWIKRRV